MAKPNLTVTVQPMQVGRATYLPLGAVTSTSQSQLEIVLLLHITNNEPNPINITEITFSFPDSQAPSVSMKNINSYKNMNLFGGADTYWSNGILGSWPNMVYLDSPAPPKVTVSLTSKNANTGTN